MKRCVSPLAGLVATVLAINGCGGPSHSSEPHAATSSARSSTSTRPASTTKTSSTPGLSPGGPVPPGTKATSVTFISPTSAFLLGTAPCQHPRCSVILRTEDRGRSWRGLPAPLEAVSGFAGNGLWGLRFADARHGYAYGNGLWETGDGSRSWHRDAAPARIVLVLAAVQERELVAVAAPCLAGQRSCAHRLTLYRRPLSSAGWTAVASTRTDSFEASIAVHGPDVWAVVGTRLYVSIDGGVSFTSQKAPCRSPGTEYGTAVSDDGPHTYLLCSGVGGAGSIAKYLYRTAGRGSWWTLAGRPPRGGREEGLSAGSDRAVVIAAAGGAGWADLGFTTSTYGVVVHGPAISDGGNDGRPGQLLLTEDGGRSWHRVGF